MRIGIAGLMHESNTFNPARTTRGQFGFQVGDDIHPVWAGAHHEVAGFIEGGERFGYEVYPLIMAGATPGGPVAAEVVDGWVSELVELLGRAPTLDGLLLALHGAMVVDGFPDGDGEVLRRVRAIVGSDFPLVVTHDFHANISRQLVDNCHALVIYKTNPHIDQRQRGLQAAAILAGMIRGDLQPTQALAKPPMVWTILHQNTSREPLRSFLEEARRLEEAGSREGAKTQEGEILAASVAAGYQYADVAEMGPSVVVVANADPDRARREADRLCAQLWEARSQLSINLPAAAEAVRMAMESSRSPVVLVDMGDNIGGGSPGDSTILLSELVRQGADGWLVVVADPESVQQCVNAGVDGLVRLRAGGKTDSMHGAPIELTARVVTLHDGRYEETEPRHGGRRFNDQGPTAVVRCGVRNAEDGNLVVLNSKRTPPFSLHQLTSLGIEPRSQKIIVVKAAIAYRAAYEPIAGKIIEVDTPGLTAVDPRRFEYQKVRRPLWGVLPAL